ncbi:MAG: fibrobacter succinogenes major paralogous domain-containing protein [Chitinophagales bacterium]
MKTRIAIIISVLFLCIGQNYAQDTMNIHQNNGTVIQIPLNTIDSITYTNNSIPPPVNLPEVYTYQIDNITSTGAETGGVVTDDGGLPITQQGICWSRNPNPTIADNFTTDNSVPGTTSFHSILSGLTPRFVYYFRAYATNSNGTAYGDERMFTTLSGGIPIVSNPGSGVTDQNGNTYSTIVLGNGQEWMSENLRTSKYANGDPIPNVTLKQQWGGLSVGAWCHYDNDSSYESPYGKLYNWYAIMDSRNICPTGWHVPSDLDWHSFTGYLDPTFRPDENQFFTAYSLTAGDKIKMTGTQYWSSSNQNATNESGFSGLPGGGRDSGTFGGPATSDGDFRITEAGNWWSTSQEEGYDWFYTIIDRQSSIERFRDINAKRNGLSVRCIKD